MKSKPSSSMSEKKHTHIWKYKGASYKRVCESPFPFGPQGCGKVELKDESGWPS